MPCHSPIGRFASSATACSLCATGTANNLDAQATYAFGLLLSAIHCFPFSLIQMPPLPCRCLFCVSAWLLLAALAVLRLAATVLAPPVERDVSRATDGSSLC